MPSTAAYQIVANVDERGVPVSYSAYNKLTGQTDYEIGPTGLGKFMSNSNAMNNEAYFRDRAANARPYERASGQFVMEALNGNLGAAGSAYARSWGEAVQDPHWLVNSGLALTGSLIAREAEAVTVYRVEGGGNQRLFIDAQGNVEIPAVLTNKGRGPERNLYLNFGDEARAQEFLEQRKQQFPDNTIKSFEVPRSFVDELRATAVEEPLRPLHPGRPVIADPTKAGDQFGLSAQQIEQLRKVIVRGSGRQ